MPPASNFPQHWFLVRGLARESAHWGEFPKKVSAALPRTVVHCIDLPGTGRQHHLKSPLRISDIAESVRSEYQQIVDREGIAPEAPKFLLAISLGAMVAVHWLSKHSGDFQGAVLINASLRGFSPFFHRLSPKGYRRIFQALWTRDFVERERHVLELTSQARSWTEKDLKERARMAQEHAFTRANFFRQVFAAATDFPPSKKPDTPLLLLNSLGDELVHPDCSWEIHKRWDVPIKRHAWAGHDLPLDDAQWTIEAIRAWMLENRFAYVSPLQKVAKIVAEE